MSSAEFARDARLEMMLVYREGERAAYARKPRMCPPEYVGSPKMMNWFAGYDSVVRDAIRCVDCPD